MGVLASPQTIGRYAIYGKIASGGMASVHFGRLSGGEGFARTVAIKRLHPHLAEDPEFRSTLIDEARLVARIHHPNVVPTLDVVAADGELLVVMEYVRGESLSRLVRAEKARGGRVPLPIASAIAIGALQGLHAAHEATTSRGEPLGVVHRDVSPQNILVGVDGVARVIDFGVAKAAGRLQTTREGVLKGKMAYMAPEQIEAREVTRAADIYAMGVVLWETLTGERLFQADSDTAVFGLVLKGAKDPPSRHVPELPPELDTLVMRALAPNPADRFGSAQEMAEMLLRIAPPAFQTAVGKWVEQAASEALAQRGAALVEIESSSGAATVPPRGAPTVPDRGVPAGMVAGDDDPPTTASEPSSVSLETPKRSGARPTRRGAGAKLAGAVGGVLLIAVAATALLWRGAPAPGALSSSTAAGTASVVSGVPVSSGPLPAMASASEEPATGPAPGTPLQLVVGSATAPPNPSTTAGPGGALPHPGVRLKPRPSSKPAAPFRFSKPD